MRIKKNNSIGLIIDMQSVLYPFISNYEQLTKNSYILIEGLKALEIPIFVTEQYSKGLGETIAPIRKLVENIDVIEKSSFSCCDEPQFMESLATSGKKEVIIAGIESHVCVLQTVIDLIEHGYNPVVVADCISSRNPENKKIAIERMKQEGATVTSFESILFELCRYSGNPTFKKISKLVK